MKIAILGSAGHYALVAGAAGAGAGGGGTAAPPKAVAGTGGAQSDAAPEPLEFLLAPVAEGEDMGPVARLLAAPATPATAIPAPAAASTAPRVLDDWRALLDRERPDAAVVNPPFHLIGTVTRECLARGIHVLAEKPLATEWEDLEAIRGLCGLNGLQGAGGPADPVVPPVPGGPKLMAMLTMRYDGAFRAARRLVAGGAVGTPALFAAQKSYPLEGWDGGPRPGFYRTRAGYGGTLPWVGIHAIDLFSWFSGSPFAQVAAFQTRLGNGGMGELESAAVLQFRLASGALASAQLDFLRRRPSAGGPVGAAASGAGSVPWGDDRLRVAGDRGTVEIRDGRVRVEDAGGIRMMDPDPPASLFADFLAWIGGGAAMPLTTEDCLKASEAALRARDAADQGRVLTF